MRSFLRAGFVLGLAVAAACSDDPPSAVDFNDPAAVSSQVSSIDSAFNTAVFQSFNMATLELGAATSPAIRPAATVLETLRPKLERTGAQVFLPGLMQARKLHAIIPNLSVSAAQGRIIPDSMYNRVFEWDTAANQYSYQGTTTTGLNGVRFVLYALGLDGEIFEPVSAIGTLDIIDESTPSLLQLHILVKNSAGTTTYVDYTASLVVNQTAGTATATVTGTITNGLSGGNNKTLSFDETFNVNSARATVQASFALNNPAITLLLNESVTFNNPNLIINADFRIIHNAETIRLLGRVTINNLSGAVDVSIAVYVDGHPVASITGDPDDPGTQWVDAGGEPLTVADLAALDALFDALENMHNAVVGMFEPARVFAGL